MARSYRNPPLAEALCEFRFAEGAEPWDWTLVGLLYQRLSDEYPKRQQNSLRLAVDSQESGTGQNVKIGVERMQFLSDDGLALVQIAPNQLIVNRLRPYPGWNEFRAQLVDVLAAYRDVAEPQSLIRVGLRYINRIEIAAERLELEDYFVVAPTIPEPLPQHFGSFQKLVEVVYDDPGMILRFLFATAATEQEGHQAFVLDLDMSPLAASCPSFENVDRWLDDAHRHVETAFDASMTEKAHKEIFLEVVE